MPANASPASGITPQPYPILEYDAAREAMLEPGRLIAPLADAPPALVLCFFNEVLNQVGSSGEVIHSLASEIGPNPIYRIEVEGRPVALTHPGVGAPLAAGFLDEVIALGFRSIIACGGAGTLIPDTTVGHLVIPTSAIRDEGTSYHYLPPAREAAPHPDAVAALEAALQARGAPYVTGKTWTTDAIYRETPAKVAHRRAEGCLTVEMEASAFFAVAEFRGIAFAQLLYCGDDLSGETWDARLWNRDASMREKILWLAVEAALRLEDSSTS